MNLSVGLHYGRVLAGRSDTHYARSVGQSFYVGLGTCVSSTGPLSVQEFMISRDRIREVSHGHRARPCWNGRALIHRWGARNGNHAGRSCPERGEFLGVITNADRSSVS